MRLGWLGDPRVHLLGVVCLVGGLIASPRLGKVAGSVEQAAVRSLDRIGHDARLALGLGECPGHVEQYEGQSDCFLIRSCSKQEEHRGLGTY